MNLCGCEPKESSIKPQYQVMQDFLNENCGGGCDEDCKYFTESGCQSPDNPNNKEE